MRADVLHLLNGDAASPVVTAAGLHGRSAVWRECLSEGPAPPRWDERTAWFARTGVAGEAEVRRSWEEAAAVLAGSQKEDEIVLWFDADLFCQANLAYLADALPEGPRITLASGTHARNAPADVRAIFDARAPFPREAYRAAWRALSSADPRGLLDVPLAFVGHHLARFPDASGLSALERRALHALRDSGAASGPGRDERWLHEAVGAGGFGEALGLTDVMLRETLGELARGPRPLYAGGRVTPLGQDVLAGRADNVRERGIDRWVGGVHLRGHGPTWRVVEGSLELR